MRASSKTIKNFSKLVMNSPNEHLFLKKKVHSLKFLQGKNCKWKAFEFYSSFVDLNYF